MGISNYPHGFENGVTIRNIPVEIRQGSEGEIFWVDSSHASAADATGQGTYVLPFKTIDYAIGRCTASKGAKIFVAAGHTESVIAAGGVTVDVAGIEIIFLGDGSNKATIDFGTAVAASMVISADNVTLIGPRFTASIDALTGPISVTGANCTFLDVEWHDGTSIDTTDCLVATGAADGLSINGWKYFPGDEGGTQKQSHIQFTAGASNVSLKGITIRGDFAANPIEMVAGAMLDLELLDLNIRSTNAGPIACLGLHASSTGWAKHVITRVASGTTYATSVALLNWENDCEGFNTDGGAGDPIGTAHLSGIEGKIDAVQTDIGDPSARTNFADLENMIGIPDAANSNLDDMLRTGFDSTAISGNADGSIMEREEVLQTNLGDASGDTLTSVVAKLGDGATTVTADLSAIQADVGNPSARTNFTDLENMIGVPDAANSNLDDMLRTGFDSSAITSNADGSVMERLEYIQSTGLDVSGLYLKGACDAGMVGSTTSLVCADLAGYGDDLFNNKYYIQVIKNDNLVGTAPETETRKITDYDSATGTFTTDPFSVNVEALDTLLCLHESLVIHGRDDANNTFASTNVAANADGSLIERQEYAQTVVDTLNTNVGDPSGHTLTSITAKLGDGATTVTADLATIDGFHDVPGADAVTNSQMRDVIGNKTDAAAAGAVSATESLMAYAKQNVTNTEAAATSLSTIDGFHDVPTADVGDNSQMRDVIGNKADAAAAGAVTATESLMAYAKQNVTNTEAAATSLSTIDGFHDVPTADVVDNNQMRDVIGNKTDAAAAGAVSATESLMAYAKQNVTNTEAAATTLSTINTNIGDPSGDTITTLTDKLGDNATTFSALVGDSDFATTESLHGKLGTDTELADRSLYDLLNGGGPAAAASAAAPANDVSLYAVLRDAWDALRNGTGGTEPGTNRSIIDEIKGSAINYNAVNYLAVTADMSSATWNTEATHEVFTVTGAVRVRILIECTETLTDVADLPQIQFGYSGATTALIGATGAAGQGGNTIEAGEFWFDTSPADTYGAFGTAIFDQVVNGTDIGYQITNGAALTDGTLVFHCWWEPLNATGTVAAGTGAAL